MIFQSFFANIAKKKYAKVLRCRYEENPALFYYSVSDFDGLKREKYDCIGDHRVKLSGYFYYYGEPDFSRVVIFDHGVGAGHRAYLKEINMLAKHGYTVYSYDHTGCVESEGDGIVGFPQSLNDLDHVITYLQDNKCKDANFSVVGHSWGAYSSLNIPQFHNEVTHVVTFGAFNSAKIAMKQYMPEKFACLMDSVFAVDEELNPKYANVNALDTLENAKAKYLIFHSVDDKMIVYSQNFKPLYEKYGNRPNTHFITVEEKNHNPYYTKSAVKLLGEMENELKKLTKKNKLKTKEQQEEFRNSYDWDRLTEQDETVWNQVFDFLDN